jgi:hypothetical protein
MTFRLITLAAGALCVLAAAHAVHAEPGDHAAMPQGHPTAPTTKSLQGDSEQSRWINDPPMHAFYEATRTAFANGPAKVDVDAYETKSFAIFREFGASMGMGAQAMQDHLKLIPRQVVQIVKADPKVLDSYPNFVAATFGPQ